MSNEQEHRIQLLGTLTRRLQILELQVARVGPKTDPALIIEIEELELNIGKIRNEMPENKNINPIIIESWLNRKMDVYTDLLSHLANMQHYYNKKYSNDIGELAISDDYLLELNNASNTAYRYIEKQIYIGDFIIISDIIETLVKLVQDLRKEDAEGDWVQDLENHYSAIVECITKVREYAKSDILNG